MSRGTKWAIVVGVLLGVPGWAHAADTSPVGYWETIDDDGKTPTSIVHIYRDGDEISGKIVKIVREGADPNALCVACSGELKDKPVAGMRIIWGMKEEDGEWGGGRILDPDSGTDYSCTMVVDGDKLQVRGFVGFSLFGRTQVWRRSKAPAS